MKIVDVRTILLSYRYPPEARPAFSGGYSLGKNAALVEITTDEGITGLGEVGAGAFFADAVPVFVEKFRGSLLGEDPSEIERLWDKLFYGSLYWGRRGMGTSVLSAIDTALWDIAGKVAGLPVYRLLGGAYNKELKVYASFIPKPAEGLRHDLERCVEAGFRAVKVKIGPASYPGSAFTTELAAYDIAKDRALVKMAREIVGRDVDLMTDIAQAHGCPPLPFQTVLRVARMLEEFDVFWLEEPCGLERIDDYAALAAAVNINVAAGESASTRFDVRDLLEKRAVDILQPDVAHIGGITEARRVAAMATEKGIPLAPHIWWTGVGMMANLHYAVATRGVIVTEYPQALFPLREELLVEPLRFNSGYVSLTDGPGLGVELRPEVADRYAYKPGSLWLPSR